MDDLTLLPASVMAEKIRRKQLSAVDLVEAHLAQIDRLNPKLNAYVHLDPESARRQAKAAEQAVMRGEDLGPLHGVPMSIKSSIDVAGFRIEAGSKLRAGNVASQDATLVRRLRGAGAIILGVTNAPELHGVGDRQSSLWPDEQSLGSFPHRGRFEWRRGGGDRLRLLRRRSR